MRNDIKDRSDIELLVRSFYVKVQKDSLLGPIFNRQISDWEKHFKILTDFWETNIFNTAIYRANAIAAHLRIDEAEKNSIEQTHFAQWLKLWIETVDELYEGTNAFIAKNKARKMSTFMYIRIFENRQKKTN